MKKCVKIIFEIENAQSVLETFIAKKAKEFKIEGVGQKIKNGQIQLYACAQEEPIDEFIDALYLGTDKIQLRNITIENCPNDRFYRGVFRIVE